MVKRKKIEPAFTYNAGFVGCRFAVTDETSGEAITVPGVYGRIRLDMIDAYHAGEPGTIVVYSRNSPEPGALIGTVEELDAIFKRHQFFAMTGKTDDET